MACDCAHTPFRTRNDWLVHLQAQHELHPHWNDKQCPFCLRSVPAGGHEMIKHVERHLRQLSLAALTANPGDDGEDSESEHESDPLMQQSPNAQSSSLNRQPLDDIMQFLRNHPLYRDASQGEDGLWHCPWEGEGYCDHKPSVLRADYEYVQYLNHSPCSLVQRHANPVCPKQQQVPQAAL